MSNIQAHAPQLAIGPANYAGQAYQWARATERVLGISALSFSHRNSILKRSGPSAFQFPVDTMLPHHRMMTSMGRHLRMRRLLSKTTHLAVDGFLPLYGRLDRSDVSFEMDRLSDSGLSVALIAHGGDVRDPDEHLLRYDFSYFAGAPREWVGSLRDSSARNRATAGRFPGCVFVSTPDLLLDLPRARWLPISIDVASWQVGGQVLAGRVPSVLHIPSRRLPPIKGTAIIDPILRKLDGAGRIRYLSPEQIPHSSMAALVGSADIVVDQILMGSYGVAAVEAMAAGRLVVGYVSDTVRGLMTGHPPIVDAPPARFAQVMDDILSDHVRFAEIAAKGPGFVERWHDGRESAAALRTFVEDPLDGLRK